MYLEILDKQFDNVIKSNYLTVKTTYSAAIQYFVPLISKLDYQRNPLRASFYTRLEKDILNGCVMPPLTIAYKMQSNPDNEITEGDLLENLEKAFVLDGIQRLNTLSRIKESPNFPNDRPIYVNILVCDSMDKLLYRMVTLNNGQRPMTARHQIEILANNLFDFDQLPILAVAEKEEKRGRKKSDKNEMSKEVIIKGYLAFISHSINIDNQKIIESKMDELIAEQIMDSNIITRESEFSDVMTLINNCLQDEVLHGWFMVANNFIGFSAAMAKSFEDICKVAIPDLSNSVSLFEEAFSAIDVSKIKLGLARRRVTKFYFENYKRLSELNTNQLLNEISQEL